MKKNKSVQESIEYSHIIGEANEGAYRPIRFSRVKYKDNPNCMIDVRLYQRGYDENEHEMFFPTKTGFQLLESEFNRVVRQWTLLPSSYVHAEIIDKSFALLNQRQFDSAVIKAFKCVEMRIRKRAHLSKDDLGVKLIRKAFDAHTGPLADSGLPIAEREAVAHYIAGAYAYYRNSCSHRDVGMSFEEAFERIVVASNILKIVEAAPQERRSDSRVETKSAKGDLAKKRPSS